jgi:hypothetical protein
LNEISIHHQAEVPPAILPAKFALGRFAFLVAARFNRLVNPQRPIATARQLTRIGAVIPVVCIAIIASLFKADIGPNKSVAAACGFTLVRARICVVLVAVIANLSSKPYMTIAAGRTAAGDTIVGEIRIPVIAGFDAYSDQPITAASGHAIGRASCLIAVELITQVAVFNAELDKPVSAAGWNAVV